MNEENLTLAEIARRNGCNDPIVLAKIERAEFISGLIHDGYTWVAGKIARIAQDIGVLFHRHAH